MSKRPKKKEPKKKQLNLGLKQSPFNILTKHKEKFELFRAKWDTKRYTKSTWVWFSIVISISLITTQIVVIQEKIKSLPKQIPLFQFYIDNTQRLASSTLIYLIPTISVIILLLGIIFSNKYYNKERVLSNFLLLTTLLATLIMSVSLIRLINLY